MKKVIKILVTITFALTLCQIEGKTIQAANSDAKIVDKGFATCLNEKYFKRSANTKISEADLRELNSRTNDIHDLSCVDYGIKDITGIEYLTNTKQIFLSDNEITDLTPIASIENLHGLYIGNNKITDISPLKNLKKLYSLLLGANEISDVSILAKLPVLKNLWINQNHINDISMLGDIKARDGIFDARNQTVEKEVKLISSPQTVFTVKGTNRDLGSIKVSVNDLLAGDGDGQKVYTHTWNSPDEKFDGKATIKVNLGKPAAIMTARNIKVDYGTKLTDELVADLSNLKITLNDGTVLDNSLAKFDLSTVNTSKKGPYKLAITVDDTADYFGSSISIKVSVNYPIVEISADEFEIPKGSELTKADFIANSNLVLKVQDGTLLNNSLASIDLSNVDTTKSGRYSVLIEVAGTSQYKRSYLISYVTVGKTTSKIIAEDFIVKPNTSLTTAGAVINSNLRVVLDDGTVLDNSLVKVDLSKVNMSREGIYPITFTLDEGKNYLGSTHTTKVIVSSKVVYDTNLRKCLNQKLGRGANNASDLTLADLERLNDQITLLDCGSRGIQYLNGLEYLTNLNRISLYNNRIKNVGVLKDINGLTELDLSDNQLTNFDTVGELKHLEWLALSYTNVKDLDQVGTLSNLRYLYLNNTEINNFDGLSNLHRLQFLGIEDAGLTDVSSLAGLTSLGNLLMDKNGVSDLRPLNNLRVNVNASKQVIEKQISVTDYDNQGVFAIYDKDGTVLATINTKASDFRNGVAVYEGNFSSDKTTFEGTYKITVTMQ